MPKAANESGLIIDEVASKTVTKKLDSFQLQRENKGTNYLLIIKFMYS